MTGIDLMVAAPWMAFGALLATICFRLLRSHRTCRPRLGRSFPPSPDPVSVAPGIRCGPAGQEMISRPHPQEARCPEKSWQARLR